MSASRRLALVTGGNKGIGYAICKQLLQSQKFNVLLATRNLDNGKSALEKLKKDIPDLDQSSVDLLQLDTSNPDVIKSSVDYLTNEKNINTLDVLVNNAGVASDDIFHKKEVERVFKTNFYGVVNTTDAYLPLLQQSTDGARILMMSSRVGAISKLGNDNVKQELKEDEGVTYERLYDLMAAFQTDLATMEAEGLLNEEGNLTKEDVKARGWWNSAYGMSKLGLSTYGRILSRDQERVVSKNIFIGSYCPGFVATDMTAAYGKNIPLGPDDGARGMVMLANPEKLDKYESGKFWCLNAPTDEELSPVDYYNCRIPRKRKEKST
eukprot:CAMPEP_0201574258 /NCGR_PEP_ID=MMETSP0190_2-20130828/18642_1 /ASSEMBLY_ACC=CAM_ASM_000263 /TAXON_ID=37353 /ORGANISM="Rosalina sp." /LENGTH=322 /DNA_ID=CAMNT_0048002275 /DNA_START=30 /DNA_END=998 /DNA_ORIENTATION=-